jgi:hypothetical protein
MVSTWTLWSRPPSPKRYAQPRPGAWASLACRLTRGALVQVVDGVFPGVTTVQLDNLAAETAAYKTTQHPDYALLAARIAMSNLHKQTKSVRRSLCAPP